MRSTILSGYLMAAVLLSVGIAGAASKGNDNLPSGDEQIAQKIRHEILVYPHFSIFDDVSFRVSAGQVELIGAVNQPFKKKDLERLAFQVPGVNGVTNGLKVLPLSTADDRLRLQIARAIYRDPALSRYAIQAVPPIHIIVDNGHITLTGVVSNELEKNIAGVRAASVGLSFGPVTNNLQVEHPAPNKG
ncbi:MAG TPA: BON domain-containing protein [Bryobacteraceae bacterium]|nr:BON domain-containing protein [Bryobacteraceae bacterium]